MEIITLQEARFAGIRLQMYERSAVEIKWLSDGLLDPSMVHNTHQNIAKVPLA